MSKAENLASLLNASGLIDSDDLAAGSVTDPKFGGSIVIDGNGNVGLGTTSPNFLLDIEGSSNSTYLRVGGDDASNDRGLKFTSSASASFNGAIHTINAPSSQGEIAFQTNSTEVLRINSSGIVSSGNITASSGSITASSGSITDDRGTVREFGQDSSGTPLIDSDYTIPSGSSGKCIRFASTVSTVTVDANNFNRGDIVTLVNQTNNTTTINFTNWSNGARVGGVNSNYNGITGPTLQVFGVCTVIAISDSRVVVTGNLNL